MKELIITICVNTIGCLMYGAVILNSIINHNTFLSVWNIIYFAILIIFIILSYKKAISILKCQAKIEMLDEIEERFSKIRELKERLSK